MPSHHSTISCQEAEKDHKNNNEILLKWTAQNSAEFTQNSPFHWWLSDGQAKLPPEIERDNVEYKVRNRKKILFHLILFYCSGT